MTETEQERISIKRPKESLDGKVISYLRSNPFGLDMDYSQAVTSTLKKHWLPLALFTLNVRGEELRQIGIWAISELEAQISIIRRICGISLDPLMTSSIETEKKASFLGSLDFDQPEDEEYEDDDDDDDEEHGEMEQLPEMIMANKALGFNS